MAKENNRTVVQAADILSALRELEFDELMPSVEAALAAFRESEKARQIEAAAKKAAKLANAPPAEEGAAGGEGGDAAEGGDGDAAAEEGGDEAAAEES